MRDIVTTNKKPRLELCSTPDPEFTIGGSDAPTCLPPQLGRCTGVTPGREQGEPLSRARERERVRVGVRVSIRGQMVEETS